MHAARVERALGGRIIGAGARDATAIAAREKPIKHDDPPPPSTRAPRRRQNVVTRRRASNGPRQSRPGWSAKRRRLSIKCAPKFPVSAMLKPKNSKGYKESWTGYKLHIDVACGQIPVACILTSASTHDSQVAIPLM